MSRTYTKHHSHPYVPLKDHGINHGPKTLYNVGTHEIFHTPFQMFLRINFPSQFHQNFLFRLSFFRYNSFIIFLREFEHLFYNDIDGEAADDESGYSVSLSSDGRTVAIGAFRNDNANGTDSGHVRVYEYDEANNKWNMLGDDIDGEAADDRFGGSVSLSSDGKTVAIGARKNDSNDNDNGGHVRVYQLQSV
jgi:hypothetical protein